MKVNKLKQYIKLMEQEGINQILLLLLEYNQPDIHRNAHMVTLDEFIESLRKQLPVESNPKQVDIEDSIAEIKAQKP